MAAMQRCSVMPDDRTWLDCTYGAQQMMRAKLGLPPAPVYQQRLVPPAPYSTSAAPYPAPSAPYSAPPAPSPTLAAPAPANRQMASTPAPTRRRASFWQVLGGSAPPVAVSPIASVTYDGRGAFIATLENGQVWRQADTDEMPKPRLRIGLKVTITQGALWSYNFRTEDNPHSYKVERQS